MLACKCKEILCSDTFPFRGLVVSKCIAAQTPLRKTKQEAPSQPSCWERKHEFLDEIPSCACDSKAEYVATTRNALEMNLSDTVDGMSPRRCS